MMSLTNLERKEDIKVVLIKYKTTPFYPISLLGSVRISSHNFGISDINLSRAHNYRKIQHNPVSLNLSMRYVLLIYISISDYIAKIRAR